MVTNLHLDGSIDSKVLQGCISGNREHQALLYKHFSPVMFGICLRYATDYHTAEDILQEGFVKVFNNLTKFRGEGSFEGWMKRIFVNTSIEYYRKAINQMRMVDIAIVPDPSFDNKIISTLAKEDLLKLIQKLPSGYRAIFNLYIIEGYSHKEIAEMLSISEGTSKSQLARARATLKRMIKEQE